MSTMHVSDSLPAYALGILDDAEQALIRAHLVGCDTCQEELRAYMQVVELLPEAVPQRTPPLRLRAAILQRAAAVAPQARRGVWPAWLARLAHPLNPAVGWLALVLIVALIGINLSLWQQTQRPAAPAPTAMAGEFRLVHMTSPQAGSATGVLIISDDGNFGTLVVDGLDSLGQVQQYQLWLVKDGKRTSGGVFSVQDNGYGVLKIDSPLPLIQYQSFGITIEPFGGSPGPTGKKVLGGSL